MDKQVLFHEQCEELKRYYYCVFGQHVVTGVVILLAIPLGMFPLFRWLAVVSLGSSGFATMLVWLSHRLSLQSSTLAIKDNFRESEKLDRWMHKSLTLILICQVIGALTALGWICLNLLTP